MSAGNGKTNGNGKAKRAAKGTPGKAGRPRAWDPTPEDVLTVERFAGLLTVGQLAHYFGVSEDTFNRRMRESPEILRAYQRGRTQTIGTVGSTLLRTAVGTPAQYDAQGRMTMPAIPPNVTAMIFYLKTQGRWSERAVEDGLSPELRALLAMATDDLERLEAMGDEEIIELLRARGMGAPSSS